MAAKNGFPIFATHEKARCFLCTGKLEAPKDSGFSPNYGKFEANCPTCKRKTWYNLAGEQFTSLPCWVISATQAQQVEFKGRRYHKFIVHGVKEDAEHHCERVRDDDATQWTVYGVVNVTDDIEEEYAVADCVTRADAESAAALLNHLKAELRQKP